MCLPGRLTIAFQTLGDSAVEKRRTDEAGEKIKGAPRENQRRESKKRFKGEAK